MQALRDLGESRDRRFGRLFLTAYLTRLPSDTLKIDRASSSNCTRRAGSGGGGALIIAIARDLGKHTVADGVERRSRWLLAAVGLPCHPGLVYARPLPPEEVSALLADGGVLRAVA